MEELLPLAFHQARHRDTGPPLDDAGDLFIGHLVPQQGFLPLVLCLGLFGLDGFFQLGDPAVLQLGGLVEVIFPLGALQLGVGGVQFFAELLHLADGVLFVLPLGLLGVKLLPHLGQFLLDLGQMLLRELVVLLLEGGLLDLVLDDLPLDDVQLRGHGVDLRPDHGAGLVYEVDGLIGKEAVSDIPVGQSGRGDDGAVRDLHAVEHLIPLFQAAQDGNGVLHAGFTHHDGLESPLQRRVLFDILAVLVECGGADAVQFTPGQHGL